MTIDRHRMMRDYETRRPVADRLNIGSVVKFNEKGKDMNAKVLRQYSNGNVEATMNGKTVSLKFTNDGWRRIGK